MSSLIFGGVLCLCSAICGFGVNKYYSKRLRFAQNWFDFMKSTEQNIRYIKKPLVDIVFEFSSGTGNDFKNFLLKYLKIISTGESDKISIDNICASCCLAKNERFILANFMTSLGKLDYDNQLANLVNDKLTIEELLKKCKNDYNSVGKLALKLGFLLGLAIMIMVV